ncbi:MAG: transposase [Betaproteobacteria bacterium]|nr:transposase [Betaproteobacteria bacterium]
MDTLVAKPAERRRRRHSGEFKRQVIEACLQPGVSVAAIALANGLNANYLRRWLREHREAVGQSAALPEMADALPATIVLATVATSAPPPEIRLDVRRGGTTVQMAWPVAAAADLGQCLRELLR